MHNQNKIIYFHTVIMDGRLEIHIVSFTIPYPPNYGGVIDIFYKIKWLSNLGVKINLHCFRYDREQSEELEKYCKSVRYYYRPKKIKHLLSKLPFIVQTRSNKKLLRILQADQLPILLEGLHSTYFLKQLAVNQRRIVLRTHNIEHEYYTHLAKQERNLFKKLFFHSEAKKLLKFEKTLGPDITIAAISEQDCKYFKSLNPNTYFIEAFHPNNQIKTLTGLGKYILFHGNLSVIENVIAALFILNNICSKVNYPFKFVGKNPPLSLKKRIQKQSNAELIENPGNTEMEQLIQNAQINLLITFQDTGIKLKLINALYLGRHCIANSKMADNSGLSKLCHIHNTSNQIIENIKSLYLTPISEVDLTNRREILLKNVNNRHSAQKLINLLDKK